MTLLLLGLGLVGLTTSRMLRWAGLARFPPAAAATLCYAALALRALLVVLAALLFAVWFPATSLFALLTKWCLHGVVPLITTHLGLDGHRLGDALTLAPALMIPATLLSLAWGVLCAARALRKVLRGREPSGPRGSTVVGGDEIVLAAAGLLHPRVVVTAGALVELDDEELAAGLEHERGHIARRHHIATLVAHATASVARPVPGSGGLLRELLFQLERDADLYALERRHDPLALASAICKTATSRLTVNPLVLPLGGESGSVLRVRALADGSSVSVLKTRAAWSLAIAVALTTLALAVTLPSAALADLASLPPAASAAVCPH